MILTGTIQLGQACLLDLVAQERRRSSLTDRGLDTLAPQLLVLRRNLLRNHFPPK
jgi:hypothetical protein